MNEQQNLCIAKNEREGEESRLIWDIELDKLKSSKLDVASAKFGGTIFNLLNMWHKGAFEDWGIPSTEEISESDDYEMAQRLIGKSVSGKTAIHIPSINLLLSQEASKNDDAKQFFVDTWPIIRERLESYSA
ncbi:hypothetical protein [Janthinobacterium fluminis]|uniref:Uncharacterized protein n=1 Tax=Janthinobacterium fluminis TaxID=2987524 RepID=A0ABT5JX36_9BURK|nr:hypothetical protein [Janthinobacterium fluminis]MDC8756990.1 hypothetical protein [Janthinobacterium fluminis]